YHFFSAGKHDLKKENAHNYFLQLAAEAGLPALACFLAILYAVFAGGVRKMRRSRASPAESGLQKGFLLGIAAYLITMLSGHPLLLSVQQFCFWMILAQAVICPPPAAADKRPESACGRRRELVLSLLLLLVLLGGGLMRWRDFRAATEYGAYAFEKWDGEAVRWVGRYFSTKIPATEDFLSLSVYVNPSNLDSEKGLEFRLSVDGAEIDRRCFFHSGWHQLCYHLPGIKDREIVIKTRVARTFNPLDLGQSADNRDLGIALKEITFLSSAPVR
ncbi:MAG: hypothetical protein JXR89_07525, partial [Deltaproteobacteria bacterium]|nr:hypothetical protein [Deltaproteobacteria bacterium]